MELHNFQEKEQNKDVSLWSQSDEYIAAVKKLAQFYMFVEMRKIYKKKEYNLSAKNRSELPEFYKKLAGEDTNKKNYKMWK